MKKLELMINEELAGRKLESILREVLKLNKRQISQAKFRKQGITINGVKVRVSHLCEVGELLQICVEEDRSSTGKVVPQKGELEILYEDEDVLVLNKPGGISCHPGRGHYEDSLGNRVAAYFQQRGEGTLIRPIGRLDKDTSGIMLYAKNQVAAARLAEQKEKGLFQKEYLALVQGKPEKDVGRIREPIGKIPGEKLKMCVDLNGKSADTSYERLKTFTEGGREYSVLRCRIATGRTHQIRIHMAWIGHSIVGDVLYGEQLENPFFPGLALHAAKICFLQPYTEKPVEIEKQPVFWEF